MQPKSYGTVRLATTNPEDHPLIDPQFFTDPEDLERLVDGIEYTTDLFLKSPSLQAIRVKWADGITLHPACSSIEFPSRDYWKFYARQTSGTHYHPTSTCRMAPNSTLGVVDSNLRVFGTIGLRVIDASVMPFVPSGNTNFPTMMVGEMGAQLILLEV